MNSNNAPVYLPDSGMPLRAENFKKKYFDEYAGHSELLTNLDRNCPVFEIIGPKGCGKTFKVLEYLNTVLGLKKEITSLLQKELATDSNIRNINLYQRLINNYINGENRDITVKYIHYKNGNFQELELGTILSNFGSENIPRQRKVFNGADIVIIDDIHYALDDILNKCLKFAECRKDETAEFPEPIQNKIDSFMRVLNIAIDYPNLHRGKKLILVSEDSFVDKKYPGDDLGIFESIDPRFRELFNELGSYPSVDIPALNKGFYRRLVYSNIFEQGAAELLPHVINTPRTALRIASELHNQTKSFPISSIDILNYTVACPNKKIFDSKKFKKNKQCLGVSDLKNIVDIHHRLSLPDLDNFYGYYASRGKVATTPTEILNVFINDFKNSAFDLANNQHSIEYINYFVNDFDRIFKEYKVDRVIYYFNTPGYNDFVSGLKMRFESKLAQAALVSLNSYVIKNIWAFSPILKSRFKNFIDEEGYSMEKIGVFE